MSENTIDYSSVKAEDLIMQREPRKATITVLHKPSGKVASDPVVPSDKSGARFRRPSTLPKENRQKGMEGYIEGANKNGLYVIIGNPGDEGYKNEYLEALANDPEALKASFEGTPKAAKASDGEQAPKPAAKKPAATQQSVTESPSEAASAPAPEVPPAPAVEPTEPISPEAADDLDKMLADLET